MSMSAVTTMPTDPFTEHLRHCTQGCGVRLDGSGPLCSEGTAVLDATDWNAVRLARNAAEFVAAGNRAAVMLDRLRALPPVTGHAS